MTIQEFRRLVTAIVKSKGLEIEPLTQMGPDLIGRRLGPGDIWQKYLWAFQIERRGKVVIVAKWHRESNPEKGDYRRFQMDGIGVNEVAALVESFAKDFLVHEVMES